MTDALVSFLTKPKRAEPCNGCGYCCSAEPCQLAKEFLKAEAAPCPALEPRAGRLDCGLVRNPLGYLYATVHPAQASSVTGPAPDIEQGRELSAQIAQALGIGKGCDADDDETSFRWRYGPPTA